MILIFCFLFLALAYQLEYRDDKLRAYINNKPYLSDAKLNKAEIYLKKVLELNPDYIKCYYHLWFYLFTKTGT